MFSRKTSTNKDWLCGRCKKIYRTKRWHRHFFIPYDWYEVD